MPKNRRKPCPVDHSCICHDGFGGEHPNTDCREMATIENVTVKRFVVTLSENEAILLRGFLQNGEEYDRTTMPSDVMEVIKDIFNKLSNALGR